MGAGERPGRLQARLADLALERALRSVAAADRFTAREELRAATRLGAHAGICAWARTLLDERLPSSVASRLAARRLFEEDLLDRASLRKEVRAPVETAERLARERGRRDLAVLDLEKARDAVDWAPAALRSDVEVKSFDSERAKLFLLFLGSGGREAEFTRLWGESRAQVDRLIAAADDLARLIQAEGRFRGPASLGASAGDPEEAALAAVRAEVEKLLAEAGLVRAKDSHAAERAVGEALQVVSGFRLSTRECATRSARGRSAPRSQARRYRREATRADTTAHTRMSSAPRHTTPGGGRGETG